MEVTKERATEIFGGTESESCEFMDESGGSKLIPPDFILLQRVMDHLSPEMKSVGSPVNRYLQNGGRFYVDLAHREYCTPECRLEPSNDKNPQIPIEGSPALYTLAGDIEMVDMARRAQVAGKIGPYAIYKRVLTGDDDKPGRYTGIGFHGNLDIRRREGGVQNNRKSRLLNSMHQATSSLYTGLGGVIKTREGDYIFVKHQKEPCLNEEYHDDTMTHRPVVNERDESLSDKRRIRIHMTSGDTNFSFWAMSMRFAIGALTLRMIDAGIPSPVTVPDGELMRLTRLASRDETMLKVATLEKGGRPYRMTPP